MSNRNVEYRSVVGTASRGAITFLFVAVLFMLLFGIIGTFLIDAGALNILVTGIILLIAFNMIIIFRQVVMEVTEREVVLSHGPERAWISREDISGIEPLELTFGRRLAAAASLGPWSAAGREKIHYFGAKAPMVLITTSEGAKYAVSVEDPEEVRAFEPVTGRSG
ncbi:MAG: hypothetical protein KKF41_10855 [Actinobacteria bacterium]|nr:hypothetical protein [Actinomycetota bacterium]MBU1944868.1 hypothetical protein [Actinomycetota bacterium]MBU2688072.1 hypothetical protein [Actinomycetota bacterium]